MANIEKLRRNLETRGYMTSHFGTAAQAAEYLCEQIREKRVGFGGSMTLEALDIYERLKSNNEVLWHFREEDRRGTQVKILDADVFLTSANAIAETGEIVNIDGTGNRLAATLFNKKKVYIIVGSNKIAENVDAAVSRARNIAAPLNARRLGFATPCAMAEEMRCYDCNHPQRICKGLLVFLQKMAGVDECEVVIVDEALGF